MADYDHEAHAGEPTYAELLELTLPCNMVRPGVRELVDAMLPIYPLTSPMMPLPGPDFIEAAVGLGDPAPLIVPPDRSGSLVAHGPWLEYLYRRAMYDRYFQIGVRTNVGMAMAPCVPGHLLSCEGVLGQHGPVGLEGRRVMVVAKNPGWEEVKLGQNLTGPTSQDFFRALQDLGVTRAECASWYITNVVKWPDLERGSGRLSERQIDNCRILLEQELRLVRPDVIICLGADALKAILPDETPATMLGRSVIRPICLSAPGQPLAMHMATVCATVHPAYTYRRTEEYDTFAQQMGRAIALTRGEVIGAAERDVRHTNIYTLDHLQEVVDSIRNGADRSPIISVDAEWHGRLPGEPGSYVRTIQFSTAPKTGYAVVLRFQGGCQAFGPTLAGAAHELRRLLQYDAEADYFPRVGGHFLRADLPWLIDFAVDVRREYAPAETPELCRTEGGWDTSLMFHACNETAQLGLTELSCKFTTAPRYDLPLDVWKAAYCKRTKVTSKTMDGYGMCPEWVMCPEPWQENPHYACLHGESRVQLADGSWEKIASLVRRRYAGKVKALVAGRVVDAAVTNWHRADVRQKAWFKLRTASTKSGRHGLIGPALTPDHKVLTRRGKVRVDELTAEDAIATDEVECSPSQLSVLLGSLLGDGGFVRQNAAGVGFGFSQRESKAAYLDWKADALRNLSPTRREGRNCLRYETRFGRYLRHLAEQFPTHPVEAHAHCKVIVTPKLLRGLGLLGLAVWYQDDGTLVAKQPASRIYATMPVDEATMVVTWLTEQFGEGVTYNDNGKFFQLSRTAFVAFHAAIVPFMHPDMAYKSPLPVHGVPHVSAEGAGVFYEPVLEVVPHAPCPAKRGNGVRYCLTVADAGNFLTQVGFVSNCYDADVTLRCALRAMSPGGLLDRDWLGNASWVPYWRAHRASLGFLEMEMTGLRVDKNRADKLTTQYGFAYEKMLAGFRETIDWPDYNPNSPDQTVFLLFGLEYLRPQARERLAALWREQPQIRPLGLTPIKSTGKRSKLWDDVVRNNLTAEYTPSTDKESLGILGAQHPIARQLRDLKFIGQILKTVLRPPGEMAEIDDWDTDWEGNFSYPGGLAGAMRHDGRVHTRLSQTKETGRASSYAPNLQAISSRRESDYGRILGRYDKSGRPKGDYLTRLVNGEWQPGLFPEPAYTHPIRSLFVADPGHFLVEVDFTGAEVAVLAWLAQDPLMIEHVRRNSLPEYDPDYFDIHSNMAVTAFRLECPPTKKGLEDIDKTSLRTAAKNVIFGIPYGRSADAIARQCREEGVQITVEETEALRAEYFAKYKMVGPFLEACRVRTQPPYQWLTNSFGRYRRFGRTWDRSVIGEQERQGQNSPIQGTVADAVNVAIHNLLSVRQRDGLQFKLVLQIHDALLFSVPEAELTRFVGDKTGRLQDGRSCVVRETMVDMNPISPLNLDGTPIANAGPYRFGYDYKVCRNWGEGVPKAELAMLAVA